MWTVVKEQTEYVIEPFKKAIRVYRVYSDIIVSIIIKYQQNDTIVVRHANHPIN